MGDAGLDRRDITMRRGADAGKVAVEVVLTRGQAAKRKGGERVVGAGEQQAGQLVPCCRTFQAEMGEQSPGLPTGQPRWRVTAFDPGLPSSTTRTSMSGMEEHPGQPRNYPGVRRPGARG